MKRAATKVVIALLLLLSLTFADRMKWSADLSKDATGGIIVESGYIYATTMDTLYKLDLLDGKTVWTLQLKGTLLRPIKMGSLLIVPSQEGNIYIVNEGTKSIIKTLNTTGEILNDPLVVAPNIYIPTSNGVQALNTQTNSFVWAQGTSCSVQSTPLNLGDKLFVPCDSGLLLLLSRANGVVIDQARYSDVFWKSSPALQDNKIILGSFSGKIYGISAKSPKSIVWVKSTKDGTSVASDIYANAKEIVVTTVGGKICSYSADGSENWCRDASSEIAAQPIVTDGGIYALSDSGTMYGFSHNGDTNWAYDSGLPVKAEIVKKGSMIYALSKNGTIAALSTSSCSILFPSQGDDVAGVDEVEVVVDPYADTTINKVQVKAEEGAWVDASAEGDNYIGRIPVSSVPMGSSKILCRVVSADGEELPPYTSVDVKRTGAGKKMNVNVPSSVGFGSSFKVKVSDENGNPLDRVTVIFGSLRYDNVNGEVKITPPAKGEYKLEVKRAGYTPVKQNITVGDDYTIIAVIGALALLAVAVFYLFYKKWIEE